MKLALVRTSIWLRSWVYPPSPRFDSEFIEATEWAEDWMPTGQEEVYGVVSTFAEKQYYLMIIISEGVDKKADEHLRFMATVGGAVLAPAAAKLISFEPPRQPR